MTLAVLVMAGILSADPAGVALVPKGFVELFEVREHTFGDKQVLQYHLFTPRDLKPGERCPMLVWLYHDDDLHYDHVHNALDVADPDHVEKYRFFVLGIPCPWSDRPWSRKPPAKNPEAAQAAIESDIIQKTIRDCPVDPDRVYLTGVSCGGNRCWNLAVRHPELFAAIAPMAASYCDLSKVDGLNMPIWVFHNRFDPVVPPEGEEKIIAAIKKTGGNIRSTLSEVSSHDCWKAAFRDHDLMAWFLEQRRPVRQDDGVKTQDSFLDPR